jgi:hypothetical protein
MQVAAFDCLFGAMQDEWGPMGDIDGIESLNNGLRLALNQPVARAGLFGEQMFYLPEPEI